MDGPLADDVIHRITCDLTTSHQFRTVDKFHILYAGKGYALLLDRAALESVAEKLEPGSYFANLLRQKIDTLTLKPKLDPEVQEAVARKAAPPPPPAPAPWRARIRIKDCYGHVDELTYDLANVSDLDEIINRCPDFSNLRNIKIKLEYML